MATTTRSAVARRPRAFVRVAGRDAEALLQRVVSNDVAALGVGAACDALLLTPKARVIAPLRVVRRGPDDFLLLTEPDLGERVRRELVRFRVAAAADVEPEQHESYLVVGAAPSQRRGGLVVPTDDFGVAAAEVVGEAPPPSLPEMGDDELELLRIEARTPRYGREIDDRVLPAEAGLVERAVSLSKGCFPGQEPVARLHYRGHANRGLRLLELEGDLPGYDAEVRLAGRAVGRVTSAARARDGRVRALAYVRAAVAPEAELEVGGAIARQLH